MGSSWSCQCVCKVDLFRGFLGAPYTALLFYALLFSHDSKAPAECFPLKK